MYIPTGKELIDPFKLLEEAGVRAAMKVADFGCGTLGHYVFPASQMVGQHGKVYAIDILKSVLGGISNRIKQEGATNVEVIWGDLERVGGISLPDNSLDIGLLVNNLFLSKQQAVMIKECTRMVKQGGKMLIADWKPTATGIGPDAAVRVGADAAKKMAADIGLIFERDIDPGKHHWGFLCRKP